MAAYYSDLVTNRDRTVPAEKNDVTLQHGRVRVLACTFTLTAELAVNDTIDFGYLPAGARILDARIVVPADAASGQLDIGWTDNGTDGADDDALFDAATEVDFGAGAINNRLLGTSAAFLTKLSAETLIQGNVIEASTDSDTNVMELVILYTVD